LEARLRQWRPRPPSAKLKDRLFGGTPEVTAESAGPTWGWLAPVGAAFLLSIMALTPSHPEGDAPGTMARMGAGRGSAVMGWIDSGSAERNVLSSSFSWTNHGRSPSSIGSFLLYNTNGLKY
jgi:hypothetical protein